MRRVLYLQYTNPAGYPPLEHSSRLLANKGWHVLFLGTGTSGASAVFQFPAHERIQVRRMSHCRPGLLQKLHYCVFLFWVLGWTIRFRPTWVYASDRLSSPPALLVSYLLRIPVIYHEHDSPAATATGCESRLFNRLLAWARRRLANCAELNILPNDRRVEHFRNDLDVTKPVLCVWNCPSREEVVKSHTPPNNKLFIVFYHGSIVPARLPLSVVHALRLLPDHVVLHFAGYETAGHPDYPQTLLGEAAKLGLASRCRYLGAVPSRSELLEHCRQASIGLALMPMESRDINESAMTGASNKPFDYLACGLPILVSDLPDWRRLFVKPGYALACNPRDPASIAAALLGFYQNPEKARQMGEDGRQQILRDWNYETQFQPVLNVVNSLRRGEY